MFEEKNPAQNTGSVTPAVPAEDMFDKTETAAPPPPRPAVFAPKEAEPAGGFGAEEAAAPADKKKFLVLGGLVLGVAVLAAGSWYGYKNYSSFSGFFGKDQTSPAAETQPEPIVPAAAEPTAGNEVKTGTGELKTPAPAAEDSGQGGQAAVPAKAKDSDDDSLSDEEEAKLGTNPNSVDSDNDGLFDYEEVKVYNTEPLKADTDGDGYNDGQEVKGGFNPLGWGKLFDNNPAKK